MRKFLLLLIFVGLVKINFAQSVFAPVGSYFTYTYTNFFGGGSQTLYYDSDTSINSVQVKKICRAGYYTCFCPTPPTYYSDCYRFILERNDSVFEYYTNDSVRLLYAFSANIGDSVVYDNYFKIVLDSVGMKDICGGLKETFYYAKTDRDSLCTTSSLVTVVRGIGPIDDYMFLQPVCNDGTGLYYFDCFNTGSCVYPSGACMNKPFALNENESIKYILSSTLGGINIQFSEPTNGTVVISNILGSITYKEQLNDQRSFQYNTDHLAKGIYLFSINKANGKQLSGKFIVE